MVLAHRMPFDAGMYRQIRHRQDWQSEAEVDWPHSKEPVTSAARTGIVRGGMMLSGCTA